ncbi:MAG TPA: hypothetical protein VFK13_07180 [Gemmatimonadaceae bacterium]|nr:hypothetical protein [Gemmatimonadaceae bacterium]
MKFVATPSRSVAFFRALARRLSPALFGALSLLAVSAAAARAQGVLVAPPGVFIDHRARSGSVELYNPGTQTVEVSISTIFGYPVTDSTGQVTLFTSDHPDSTQPSAAGWLQAYPRRLTLRPRERQTVRILGRPPQTLADGEYWSRLVITAKGATLPVTASADSAGISIGLSMEVRTVVAVLYRKGRLNTGVALSDVHTALSRGGDSLYVRTRLERQGNAAFIGVLHVALERPGESGVGARLAQGSLPLAVYYDLSPRVAIPVVQVAPGAYTLRVWVDTDREDVARELILPSKMVRDSATVVIPPRP